MAESAGLPDPLPTSEQHARSALDNLRSARNLRTGGEGWHDLVTTAQVHATLSVAAATREQVAVMKRQARRG